MALRKRAEINCRPARCARSSIVFIVAVYEGREEKCELKCCDVEVDWHVERFFLFICKGKFERVAENESERFEKRGTA